MWYTTLYRVSPLPGTLVISGWLFRWYSFHSQVDYAMLEHFGPCGCLPHLGTLVFCGCLNYIGTLWTHSGLGHIGALWTHGNLGHIGALHICGCLYTVGTLNNCGCLTASGTLMPFWVTKHFWFTRLGGLAKFLRHSLTTWVTAFLWNTCPFRLTNFHWYT